MPGIAGILNASAKTKESDPLLSMLRRMCYESVWFSGQTRFGKINAEAGWVCRPGSFADALPVWNEDRTVGLVFTGEDFAARERIGELQRDGYTGPSEGAGLLVALYEKVGPRFFAELNGSFAGLLVDLRKHEVILFNDRYGLGRIYYHHSPEGFFFASEAKSLLAALPHLRELDSRGLAEYFSVGCVLQNRSLFKDISLLPSGSLWTFHANGQIDRQRYFDPKVWEQQEPLDASSYAEQLQEVFSRVAPRYLYGSSRVGVSLTGGLDSRLLLAWSPAMSGTLPCYTFGGPYRDCADVKIARRLAEICGQPHTTIPVGDDFFGKFPTLAEQTVFRADGAMDVSGAVELYVNEKARQIAPVRLTGNYGSEILRSHIAFRPARLDRTVFTPEFCALLDLAEDTYRAEATGNLLSFIAFKQVPWHHYGRLAVEQSVLTLRSPFLDNDLVALAYRVPSDLAASPVPLLQLIAAGNPELDRVSSDRALRHRSIPVFSYLAREWQEFTAKAEYAYDYGMPQRFVPVDHRLRPLRLERLFLGRHKFYHYRIWYKDRLCSYLREQSSESLDQPGCYRRGAGKTMIADHLSGRRNHTSALHKLLSASLTTQLFTS